MELERWVALEGITVNSEGKEEKFGLFLDANKVKVIRRRGITLSIYMDDGSVQQIDFANEKDLNDTFLKLSEAIAEH